MKTEHSLVRNTRRTAGGHSTKPLQGNTVKFSVHRVGDDNYRRFDTILSYDLVKHSGLRTGDRVDVQFNAGFTQAVIGRVAADKPATRLQRRRDADHPHGLIAVRIPVKEAVVVPCIEAHILSAPQKTGVVRVRVPAAMRDALRRTQA